MPEYFISFEQAESDLLGTAAYLAERIRSSDGLAEAIMTIVPIYLAKGEVDLAAELANSVDDPFTRDKLLIEVAEKCAELGDDDYALQLADAIEDFGLKSQALEKIALQKANKGHTEKALEIANEMEHPDYVLAAVAINHSASGNETEAAQTLEKIEFAAARVSALQAMAMEKLSRKENDAALALLGQADEAASEIEHNEEKIRSFCEVGNHFVEAGKNDKAIESYDKAKAIAEGLDNIHRDSFLAAASLGFLHAGSIDLADRTLDLISDKTQIASVLLGFARNYWHKEEKDEAVEALEEAYAVLKSQRGIETRDSRARFALLGSMATQFAGFGKAERGIGIVDELADNNEKVSAQSQIAQILTIQNDDAFARQVIESIADETSSVFALIGVADTKINKGEKEKAAEIFNEAIELAEDLPQLPSRVSALVVLAESHIKLGDIAKAQEISRKALNAITQIRDESNRAIALAGLSDIFERAGMKIGDVEKPLIESLLRKSA